MPFVKANKKGEIQPTTILPTAKMNLSTYLGTRRTRRLQNHMLDRFALLKMAKRCLVFQKRACNPILWAENLNCEAILTDKQDCLQEERTHSCHHSCPRLQNTLSILVLPLWCYWRLQKINYMSRLCHTPNLHRI